MSPIVHNWFHHQITPPIAPLQYIDNPFFFQCVKCQWRLTWTRHSGYRNNLIFRQGNIYIFQVMCTHSLEHDFIFEHIHWYFFFLSWHISIIKMSLKYKLIMEIWIKKPLVLLFVLCFWFYYHISISECPLIMTFF